MLMLIFFINKKLRQLLKNCHSSYFRDFTSHMGTKTKALHYSYSAPIQNRSRYAAPCLSAPMALTRMHQSRSSGLHRIGPNLSPALLYSAFSVSQCPAFAASIKASSHTATVNRRGFAPLFPFHRQYPLVVCFRTTADTLCDTINLQSKYSTHPF